jgi:hypothetical protein
MKYILLVCYIWALALASAARGVIDEQAGSYDARQESESAVAARRKMEASSTAKSRALKTVPAPEVTDCWTCAAKGTSKICNYGGRQKHLAPMSLYDGACCSMDDTSAACTSSNNTLDRNYCSQ